MDKNKVLYITQSFTKGSDDADSSVLIEGYANTTDVDRVRDVIPKTAWQEALTNYLKNPIILAYHNHSKPIGKMTDHRIDDKGLWIKARITESAGDVYKLIKDEVLSAFSVGFRVKDAVYDAVTDLFVIKELELLEISVVSVPCNQDSLFSLSKAFENAEDYSNFKSQFAEKEESTKELDPPAPKTNDITKKEWNMDPKELEQMLAKASADAAAAATKAMEEKIAAEKAAAEAETKRKAELDAAIKSAIEVRESGAEKLLKEVEDRFAKAAEDQKNVLAGLEGALKEKAEEIAKLQNSRMQFEDKGGRKGGDGIDYTDKENAVLAAKIMGKSLQDTKIGRGLIEKAGAHQASATWELEVSLNMENEIRRKLVVANLIKPIQMQTNVMTIPVNPEAGTATWMANTAFGTTESPGAAQTHQLKEITLNAYKVATREYVAYEEEEDSLIVLLPIIRDAMIRRVARGVDTAFARGAGSGSDPVKGFATYDATSAVNVTNTGVVTTANLRSLRKDLGVWGLDPSEMVFVVSTDAYYDLLDDTLFQTMNNVGAAATLLNGQIGQVGGTPVIVSDALHNKTTGTVTSTTNYGAIAVCTANFIAGSQRGLRFDTQDLVETQRKVLVASLRTGMTQLSTVNGLGVSVLRWS